MMGTRVNCSWDLLSGGNSQAHRTPVHRSRQCACQSPGSAALRNRLFRCWNNSKTTYWGVTDLLDGKGSQRGYYNNIHADK
jgi:hypothetical protein